MSVTGHEKPEATRDAKEQQTSKINSNLFKTAKVPAARMEAVARSKGGTTEARTISEQPELPAQI